MNEAHQAVETLSVHRLDRDFYYMDFGPALKGRTISAVASIGGVSLTAGVDDPTVDNQAVLTVATTVYVSERNTRTIEANTGIKFKVTDLDAGAEYRITASVTLSDGNVLGLDGLLKTG